MKGLAPYEAIVRLFRSAGTAVSSSAAEEAPAPTKSILTRRTPSTKMPAKMRFGSTSLAPPQGVAANGAEGAPSESFAAPQEYRDVKFTCLCACVCPCLCLCLCVCVYPPSPQLLFAALLSQVAVMVDIPWPRHAVFPRGLDPRAMVFLPRAVNPTTERSVPLDPAAEAFVPQTSEPYRGVVPYRRLPGVCQYTGIPFPKFFSRNPLLASGTPAANLPRRRWG